VLVTRRRRDLLPADLLGRAGELLLDGGDLGLEAGSVVVAVLGACPLLLLDELDELQLQPDHVIFEAGVGHLWFLPIRGPPHSSRRS
jgi:hypothetical protein